MLTVRSMITKWSLLNIRLRNTNSSVCYVITTENINPLAFVLYVITTENINPLVFVLH